MNDSNEPGTALTGEVLDAMPAHDLAVIGDNPYLRMIEKVVDRGGDLTTLDKLLDLKMKWEADEARKAFNIAFAEFKSETIKVIKGTKITDGPLKGKFHANLHDVVVATAEPLAKHGLTTAWRLTKDEPGLMEVTCVLKHARGHSESVSMMAAPDTGPGRNAIQARGSAKTYLERYTLMAILGLAASEQDDDGGSADPPAKLSPAEAKAAHWIDMANRLTDIVEYGKQREKLLKEYGGANNLPADVRYAFNVAKAACEPKDAE